jgi:Flp pilus assembly protein TadD
MADTILTRGQRRLHLVVLVLGLYLVANAAYLFFFPPPEGTLPAFYQWMLVSHVVLGIVLLVPMTVFVAWHLRRALAMNNPKAIWTGAVITVASFALFVTGLFIFSQANSVDNAWAFLGHRVLALVVPLGYVLHRLLSRHRPPAWAWKWGLLSPVALLGLFAGAHFATLPEPRPRPQSFVAKPPEGVDPFRESFPEYGVSGAPEDTAFFPAATRSITGNFLPKGLLTNNDVSTGEKLKEEVARHGFAVEAKIGSETCARCHQDIVEQWSRSAHRYASFNNPFYRAAVEALRAEPPRPPYSLDSRQRSQWCAGCHDPAIMMAGNMTKDIDPNSPESQAGLTCLACHLMDEVHGVGGNGNYRINDGLPSPYLFNQAKGGVLAEVHDLLVKSKPDVHKKDMLKPVFRTSEYCGTCHKVSLDSPVNGYRWIRGQNEYDNHQDSGVTHSNARTWYLPPATKNCQDCHMPHVDAPLGDVSAKGGKVRSHLFLGPNTALPHVRGDARTVSEMEKFLQEAKLRVDVFAVRQGDRVAEAPDVRPVAVVAGEEAEFHVVVRNQGVGHTFPGGTLDSNESWVHFTVADAADPSKVLWESGAVDPATKRLDRDAHQYRVVFVDEQGKECDRRNPQDFRAVVHVKVIGPSQSDVVRYALTPPREWAGRKLLVSATLKWRKFNRPYTEFVWRSVMPGRPVPDLPITDIAAGRATFDVVASPAAAAPVPAERIAKDWQRWNDWGVGLTIQGDTAGSQRAFGTLRDADPARVDGWRNLARAKLVDGDARGAFELLQEADRRDPGNPQTAYFLAQALERLGQLDAALEQFAKAEARFPGDRTIHQQKGQILYRQGKWDDAMRSFLRVLAIDPEDRTAHYHRMLLYRAKAGDAEDAQQKRDLEHAAAEAEKAFRKFSIDESAQKWTNDFRRDRPDVNFESQPVHVHRLEMRK